VLDATGAGIGYFAGGADPQVGDLAVLPFETERYLSGAAGTGGVVPGSVHHHDYNSQSGLYMDYYENPPDMYKPLPPGFKLTPVAPAPPPEIIISSPGQPIMYAGSPVMGMTYELWSAVQAAGGLTTAEQAAAIAKGGVTEDDVAAIVQRLSTPVPAQPEAAAEPGGVTDLWTQYTVPIIAGFVVVVIGLFLFGGSNVREKRHSHNLGASRV
jgi:hypothetical protein